MAAGSSPHASTSESVLAASGPAARRAAPGTERRLWTVLLLTLAYLAAQIVGGLLTNSLALLADAGHMLADVLAVAMSLAALRVARRPATSVRTFGFYRAETLAALANALVLMAVALGILVHAWERLQKPLEVQGAAMLAVAVGGLVVNGLGVWLLHEHAQHSLNVESAYLEVLGDLLGSLGVVAAALVILLAGWTPADALVSVLIAALILPRTWRLLHSVLDVLLEAAPRDIALDRVAAAMQAVPGVVSVHDLHVWTITSGFVAMSGHVQSRDRGSGEILHDLQALLRRGFGIQHATLQVEPCGHPDEVTCCGGEAACPSGSASRPG